VLVPEAEECIGESSGKKEIGQDDGTA
jgi:hypothetical protein